MAPTPPPEPPDAQRPPQALRPPQPPHPPGVWGSVTAILLSVACLALAIVAGVFAAFRLSPWPSAMLIRRAFDTQAEDVSRALERHVPRNVSARIDEHYDPEDHDARLDVFYPSAVANTNRLLPAVVWIHGGGWLSGSKRQIANYSRILASRGYTVVGVDYSEAPQSTYPTPVRQVNRALGYLAANAVRLHIDPRRIVLAGDSGGAHIAAQLANAITVPAYAGALGVVPAIDRSSLFGMLLYCGVYDVSAATLDSPSGEFQRTMLWSYSGNSDFMHDPDFATASVLHYVTPDFPPTFISTGNADWLNTQSHAFAAALAAQSVPVDSLFFPPEYSPPLSHEYQFNLDNAAGHLALERSVRFLASLDSRRAVRP